LNGLRLKLPNGGVSVHWWGNLVPKSSKLLFSFLICGRLMGMLVFFFISCGLESDGTFTYTRGWYTMGLTKGHFFFLSL
jgi:hypothetical protein